MRANSMCLFCMLRKQDKLVRQFDNEEKKAGYLHRVLEILYKYGQSESAPWLAERINELYEDYWGKPDYTPIKHKYNRLLLDKEKEIEQRIRQSDDCIKECIKYVCAANYNDFSAVENISEQLLEELLNHTEAVSEEEYSQFIRDLEKAHKLAYLTDNCGEIVLDKLFIRFIRERYPSVQVYVIVRGKDVINDASVSDAREVGLTELVPCIGNGNGAPGSVIKRFSEKAKKITLDADLIIAKGQGNFEGLFGEGLNPYYFFLCKCELFVRRFGLRQFESVFIKEERIASLLDVHCRNGGIR